MRWAERGVRAVRHASTARTALLALVLLPATTLAQPAAAPDPAALLQSVLATAADAARGQEAFDDCSGCHRRDASGRAGSNIPRLSGQHTSVIVKQILDIRSGLRSNPPMKPFVDAAVLPLQAVADIASYLSGLPLTGNIVKGPGSDLVRGRQLYQRDCAACHGAAGEGQAALQVPMLAAQHYPYLLRELGLIRDGARGNSNPAMVALVKGYGSADLQAVADHLAQLPAPTR